jgi:uncharacterized repeat protein (TIGR03803 family)
VLGADGNLYGTTEFGGTNSYGTIFKITPAGVLTVLYDFTGNADGGYPVAPLVLATDGNFYGTSYPGRSLQVLAQRNVHRHQQDSHRVVRAVTASKRREFLWRDGVRRHIFRGHHL